MQEKYLRARRPRRARARKARPNHSEGSVHRDLIEILPDAVLVTCNHKIAYANPACMRLFAAEKREQLIGKDISEMILPEEMPDIDKRIAEHHRTGGTLPPSEHVCRALNGSLVEIEAAAVPCRWNELPAIVVVLRDVRERKRAQKDAREWQQRLELAQQSGLKIGRWEWDVAAGTTVWDDQMSRLFGYAPGTLSGRVEEAVARIHPEDQARVEGALQKIVQGDTEFSSEYRVVRSDGSICWIDARGVLVDGSTHMLGIAIDISRERVAQQALQESEENFRMLLDSTAEGIYAVDLNGICIFCNPAAIRMFGHRDASELLGHSVHVAHHHTRADGTTYPESECSIYRSLRGEGVQVQDEYFYRVDGSRFPIDCWAHPVRRGPEIVGAVVTFLDITERAKAEKLLRDSEANFRSIVESAPYGVYRSTMAGQIILANTALVNMLGYESEEELLSLNVGRDIYRHPEQRPLLVAQALEQGFIRNVEIEWKRKDGTPIVVRANGLPLRDEASRLEWFQVFVEDVTERKSLERQFWEVQKLEAVGRLAGGVAHDFNNVLMIVSSYADLILQRNKADHKSIAYAKEIHQAALRAANVTQQLLAFSRKQVLELEVLDPNTVLRDLGKMLSKLLGEDVKLVIDLDPAVSRIKADRGQLEQIIMNLSVNARDAMPKGGCLSVQTRNVELDAAFASEHPPTTPGKYVKLSVCDTGIGMDAQTQARIFEPFFTTKERGKGTGLGLASVYGIVKQSGGFIWVNSEAGKGTTFDIYLPASSAPLRTLAHSFNSDLTLRGSERILLVEDEEQLLAVTRDFLEGNGYFVISARNAPDALRAVQHETKSIDLLLTDVIMPELDGVELATSIRSRYPAIKVLYMSGYTDRALPGLGEGTVLLRKPFSQQLLATKIRDVLESPVAT
jgi:two-component system, cell cycle sensor histidine kinase and response regulator CckA